MKLIPYSEEAVQTLAKVLVGPVQATYWAESSSKLGKYYTIEVNGVDLLCNCPGFGYRGSCVHSRTLKDSLVSGGPLP